MNKKESHGPGVYIIRLAKPAFDLPAGRIIYIGKGDDVEKRLNQELGRKSGPATFFRSVGVMLEKTVIPGSRKNFEFYEREEIVEWLKEHTKHSIRRCDWRKEEINLIKKHRPPFNIKHNSGYYYPGLLERRQKAKAIAIGTTVR